MSEAGATTVLVIEDDDQMRRFLRASLSAHGYRALEATTGKEGVQLATSHNPDVVLLDLGLPDTDGIDLTRRLREWSRVPIIVISARGRTDDKVEALDAGADDYLTKPFGLNELLARMRVALRHARERGGGATSPILEVGPLRLDLDRRELSVGGREVRVTPIEWKLAVLFARHAGRVLTHAQILHEVWGPGQSAESHHVRVHVAELRKKIEADPAQPKLLVTEPGVGYRLKEPPR